MAARSRTKLVPFLALLVMAAAWGSTFILIKDVVIRIPVPDSLPYDSQSRAWRSASSPGRDSNCHAMS